MIYINNLKKNLTFQTIYQLLTVITPLITSPYLSRVLGAEMLGIYSYTQSLVNYFVVFSMLGFVNYGTRTIALASQEDKERKFCEIYYVQVLISMICLILYFLFCLFFENNYIYMILQSFFLVSCLFDVTWYFFGNEDYKTTVVRNIIIKILTVIAIIIFIKDVGDLKKYIFIMSFSTFMSQFSVWVVLKRNVKFHKVNIKNAVDMHLKNVIVLFLPYLAMTVYHLMDKTMLGVLSTSTQSGFYYNSDKVVNVPLSVLNGLGIVMLSKVSALRKEESNDKEIEKILNYSIYGISCLAIAFAFGIAGVSEDFVPLFFGEGYEECILLVNVFCAVIFFKAISDIIRTQYFIPFKKEKKLTICVVIGAGVNLIANIILIKVVNLNALGATLATLLAEGVVCIIEIYYCKKQFKIINNICKSLLFIIPGIVMFTIVKIISKFNLSIILKLFLEITCGALIYMFLSYILTYCVNKELFLILKKRSKCNKNES